MIREWIGVTNSLHELNNWGLSLFMIIFAHEYFLLWISKVIKNRIDILLYRLRETQYSEKIFYLLNFLIRDPKTIETFSRKIFFRFDIPSPLFELSWLKRWSTYFVYFFKLVHVRYVLLVKLKYFSWKLRILMH